MAGAVRVRRDTPATSHHYVDPRPEMLTNKLLREQIRDFQSFLVRDLWLLAKE
jgi:hypothetical protein